MTVAHDFGPVPDGMPPELPPGDRLSVIVSVLRVPAGKTEGPAKQTVMHLACRDTDFDNLCLVVAAIECMSDIVRRVRTEGWAGEAPPHNQLPNPK